MPASAPYLAGWLAEAGLEHVGAEIHGPIAAGGSEYWARGSIEQLADHLVATGLVTAADVQRYLTLAADPAFLYPAPILVSAWGQRPAGLPDGRSGQVSRKQRAVICWPWLNHQSHNEPGGMPG